VLYYWEYYTIREYIRPRSCRGKWVARDEGDWLIQLAFDEPTGSSLSILENMSGFTRSREEAAW